MFGANTVIDQLASVVSCCRSHPGLVVIMSFQKVGDITRDDVVGFFVDCAQIGFHISSVELLPFKFGNHFRNTGEFSWVSKNTQLIFLFKMCATLPRKAA